MTHDRWTNGDSELTNALRVLYAAPEGESYWDALEARILDYVARGDERSVWWDELAYMIRPGLIAAAALILAATVAMALLPATPGSVTEASLGNPVVTIILSMIVGAIFGYVSEKVAGMLMGAGDHRAAAKA